MAGREGGAALEAEPRDAPFQRGESGRARLVAGRRFIRALGAEATAAFRLGFWDGSELHVGEGDPAFRVEVVDEAGLRALASLDELRICEAYIAGELEFEGDLLAAFDLRRALRDGHPILDLARRLRPLLTGQVRDDRRSIETHYEYDDDFYELLLDETRTYSQGVYEADDEPLAAAMRRKLDFAIEACRLRPGDRVLDVGGGWGAFTEHAGTRGIEVTSLTISDSSHRYLEELIAEKDLPCRAVLANFLEYEPRREFDAVVILGVIEHMPDYRRVVRQLQRNLRIGGRAYLDGSATTRKYDFNTFLNRYIYPGNHCCLSIHDFLAEVQAGDLELIAVHNDRHSYYLTARAWAEKLESARDEIVRRWGPELYRKFRLYLWGTCHNFLTNQMQAYRLVLANSPPR